MKTNYIIISFLLIAIAVTPSCKKKGCTDPSATNYNNKAKKDDGLIKRTIKKILN